MTIVWMTITFIFIANIYVFVKIIKKGELTSKIVNHLLIFFGILIIILPFLPQPRLTFSPMLQTIVSIFSVLCGITGIFLEIMAISAYKKNSIPLTPNDWSPPEILDKGVYGIIRHPQYAGGLLIFFGIYLSMKGVYALFIIFPLIILTVYIRAYYEERYILLKKFPQEYPLYQRKAGMFFPKILKSS